MGESEVFGLFDQTHCMQIVATLCPPARQQRRASLDCRLLAVRQSSKATFQNSSSSHAKKNEGDNVCGRRRVRGREQGARTVRVCVGVNKVRRAVARTTTTNPEPGLVPSQRPTHPSFTLPMFPSVGRPKPQSNESSPCSCSRNELLRKYRADLSRCQVRIHKLNISTEPHRSGPDRQGDGDGCGRTRKDVIQTIYEIYQSASPLSVG